MGILADVTVRRMKLGIVEECQGSVEDTLHTVSTTIFNFNVVVATAGGLYLAFRGLL